MTTETETLAARYERLSYEFASLRHVRPEERTEEQQGRLVALSGELRAMLATPPNGYELPRLAADLMAHAEAHGWTARVSWTPPGYSREPYTDVEVGLMLDGLEREQHRGDRWYYKLCWHSRDCAPGKVRLFGSGLAQTPDSPRVRDAPSVKAIRAVIEANPGPGIAQQASGAPIIAGDLYSQVLALADDRCQCTGACGKKHADANRTPGRCESIEHGRAHLLALPRNPLLPWHKAAGLAAKHLIAFCPDCAGGVRRAINRGIKAQAPQEAALFDAEIVRTTTGLAS